MHFERVLLLSAMLVLTGCTGPVTRVNRAEKTPVGIERVGSFGTERLLSPVSICADIQGNLYVGDEANVGVHKFAADYRYEMAFGDFGLEESQLIAPTDLFCDGFSIYVVDGWNERIAKYDRNGGFLGIFVPAGAETLGTGLPVAVAVSASGQMYVLETRPGQVVAIDEYGRSKSVFGRFGGGSGLSMPTAMALGPESEVYVCDGGGRIVIYDRFGGYLRELGGFGSLGDIAVDMTGNIYVSDLDRGAVTCYDRQGNSVASLTGLTAPRAIALMGEDTLLVVDSENGSVVICKIRFR